MKAADRELKTILDRTKSIAMVGVSANPVRPSFFVGRYLTQKGYQVHPVNPVYDGQRLFGADVRKSLKALRKSGKRVEMVDIFRKSEDALPVVEEALEQFLGRGLQTIWMQIGVENKKAAKLARAEGLTVVMNRCPKIELFRPFWKPKLNLKI